MLFAEQVSDHARLLLPTMQMAAEAQAQAPTEPKPFSPEELDQMLAPIAKAGDR